MTVQEALEILHGETREDALYQYDREDRPYILARAERMAIQALEEVEQYRALGTVEELKEAREKQVAKKPIMKKREHILHYECPCCGFTTLLPHCGNCGQKIDWSDEE
jgi:rubrerythrin